MKYVITFLFVIAICFGGLAQRRVKLKNSDELIGSIRNGVRFDRLLGNVVFVQNNTTINCDSAHFFKSKNRIEAYGRVHITDGDSVDVTSHNLTYDGDKRVAYLRNNVVFKKLGIATLYTDFLDYDRPKGEARYFNGGKLVDSTNVLTSKKGYYDLRTNLASFKREVVSKNPDYTLTSDTLQYNSKTKIIYFKDLTKIVDKDGGTANYTRGFYNTTQKTSALAIGEFETAEYKVKGNDYDLDDNRKYYKVKGKVVMTSKEENMIIFGDETFYDKKKGISKVYGNSYAAKIDDEKDTLFISADTLVSIENEDPAKKRLLAYHNVKIFRSDLQGIADSLVYRSFDSTLFFYRQPALWANENQMTADSIRIMLKNKKIDKLYMTNNAFVVSQDSLKNFNQIKGRKMTTIFQDNKINSVLVEGNAESIYFALEEKTEEKENEKITIMATMGMNKMICSKMKIGFKEGNVDTVSAFVKPDAQFIPPHEIKPADKTLKGFSWKQKERPTKNQVVKNAR